MKKLLKLAVVSTFVLGINALAIGGGTAPTRGTGSVHTVAPLLAIGGGTAPTGG
jgi:hypothetical protein